MASTGVTSRPCAERGRRDDRNVVQGREIHAGAGIRRIGHLVTRPYIDVQRPSPARLTATLSPAPTSIAATRTTACPDFALSGIPASCDRSRYPSGRHHLTRCHVRLAGPTYPLVCPHRAHRAGAHVVPAGPVRRGRGDRRLHLLAGLLIHRIAHSRVVRSAIAWRAARAANSLPYTSRWPWRRRRSVTTQAPAVPASRDIAATVRPAIVKTSDPLTGHHPRRSPATGTAPACLGRARARGYSRCRVRRAAHCRTGKGRGAAAGRAVRARCRSPARRR